MALTNDGSNPAAAATLAGGGEDAERGQYGYRARDFRVSSLSPVSYPVGSQLETGKIARRGRGGQSSGRSLRQDIRSEKCICLSLIALARHP